MAATKKTEVDISYVRPEVYINMYDDVMALPDKQRRHWKHSVTNVQGVRSNVTYRENGGFFTSIKGRLTILKPVTAEELLDIRMPAGSANVHAATRDQFMQQVEANHTGNHGPRRHAIHVPTAAGQPVRG